jgi:hypothetical protein
MANRNFMSSKLFSMHAMPVMVTATIQIGASGAVTSTVGSMVSAAEELSTGVYKITMQTGTNFTRLFSAMASMQSASGGLSGIVAIEIQNAPNASVSASTMTLTIRTLDADGALAAPADGSAINLLAILSNSSVLVGGE